MSHTRILLASLLLLAAFIGASLLWAEPPKHPNETKQQASEECQKEFDLALDNCLGGGHGGTECMESAAASWSQCMRAHGYSVMGVPPGVRKGRPIAPHPSVAPPTPKPPKFPHHGLGTTAPQVAPGTPTPSRRPGVDSGSTQGSIKPINPERSATPATILKAKPTPRPTPVRKKKD